MEYLMTYGWAILLIAVVLVALFYTGIFGTGAGPRAQPGSCSVLRPLGAGISKLASLQGTCGNLIPEFVMMFSGNGYGNIETGPTVENNLTITAWVLVNSTNGGDVLNSMGKFVVSNSTVAIVSNNGNAWSDLGVPADKWSFVAFSQSSNTYPYAPVGTKANYIFQVNGASDSFSGTNGSVLEFLGSGLVGGTFCGGCHLVCHIYPCGGYTGGLANIQIYNTSLTESQLQQLYMEGIGGVPINLNNIVMWYPLNGGTDDYSGNGYNFAVITNTSYTSTWTSMYTAP